VKRQFWVLSRRFLVPIPNPEPQFLVEYEIHACTRRCAVTGRDLAPGEAYYSALLPDGLSWRRADYSIEAWQGPPAEALGWWKSQRPDERRRHWAPNDILLDFFDQLEGRPDTQDTRYVLALFLVRRRVMRLEDTETDPAGGECLVLACPRRDTTHRVPVVAPDEARANQIQEELARLLR
jgi:hypothetical protein